MSLLIFFRNTAKRVVLGVRGNYESNSNTRTIATFSSRAQLTQNTRTTLTASTRQSNIQTKRR